MNRRIRSVVSEETYTKPVKRRGAPSLGHRLRVVYRLECGHTATRDQDRSRPAVPVGHKIKCHECAAGKAHVNVNANA